MEEYPKIQGFLVKANMKYMDCNFSKIRNRDKAEVKIKDHEVCKE